MVFKKQKLQCKYWRACIDYRRSKEICHDGEWINCWCFKLLEKKEKKLKGGNK